MRVDSGGDVYSLKAFRDKFEIRYKNNVYFVKSAGRSNEIVGFTNMADFIMRNFKTNSSNGKKEIIIAAARIIKEDIRNMKIETEEYPSVEDIFVQEEENPWVPDSLRQLMKHLIPTSLKRISLSQCIVQAARPRSAIVPIPFGIGVSLEKSFGSKWLNEFVSKLGLAISSNEVHRNRQQKTTRHIK